MPEVQAKSIVNVKIAIVRSLFNQPVTDKLLAGAINQLAEVIDSEQIMLVHVPGAVEIPFAIKKLLQTEEYDAVIALGAVIRGETTHYDYVCDQVSQGCAKLMLDFNTPVIFGVLTTENSAQAFDRVGGAHGHKGEEAAQAALDMISINRQLESMHSQQKSTSQTVAR